MNHGQSEFCIRTADLGTMQNRMQRFCFRAVGAGGFAGGMQVLVMGDGVCLSFRRSLGRDSYLLDNMHALVRREGSRLPSIQALHGNGIRSIRSDSESQGGAS